MEDDLKEMLNTMKVEEFREKRQIILLRTAFQAIKSTKQCHPHYYQTLICKVMKGLMISGIQLRAFSENLEDIYVRILLQKHFEAIKEFNNIMKAERQQFISEINKKRKAYYLRKWRIFRKNHRQKNEESKVEEFKFYTQSNFKPKEVTTNLSRNTGFKTLLEDSRKSVYSLNSRMNSSKRRYEAVKQLPRMPDLVLEQDKQMNHSEIQEQKHIQKDFVAPETIKQSKKQPEQILSRETIDEKTQQKKKTKLLKDKKDTILFALSQLKILQISHLSSIVEESTLSLKQDSLLSQKNILSISISTLKHIISL